MNNNKTPDTRRPAGRRYRPEENQVTPVGIGIMVAAAVIVVSVVLLVATGVFRVPSSGTTSSAPETSSVPESVVSEVSLPDEPASSTVSLVNDPNVPYQSLCPELAWEQPVFTAHTEGDKTVYLTFNDGPSSQAEALLQLLQEKNVPATFFVSADGMGGADFAAALQSIHAGGHALGVRGYSDDMDTIYASVDNYLADFKLCDDLILEATGQRTRLCRFPGGSGNNYFTGDLGEAVADEMLRRGYVYHDWNVDASGSASAADVVEACGHYDKNVVLLSNSGGSDVEHIGDVIDALKEAGYRFALLDDTVKPYRFY